MSRHLRAVPTAIVVCIIGLTPIPAASQSEDAWAGAQTPWGDPDLQGVWSYATLTPLQRPAEVEGRPLFTPEEVAAWTTRAKTDRPRSPRGRPWRLQRPLAGWRGSATRSSYLADRRPPKRPAAVEGHGAGRGRGAQGPSADAPGRFLARPYALGSLYHVSRCPAGWHKLQQHVQHPPDARVCRHPGGEHPRRPDHSDRQPAAPRRQDLTVER